MGWRPAKVSLTNSRLDDYVDDVLKGRQPSAGMSPEQAQEQQQMGAWLSKLRNAKTTETKANTIKEMVEAGVGPKTIEKALGKATAPDPKMARYSILNYDQLGYAWDRATDIERKKLFPLIVEKITAAKPEAATYPVQAQKRLIEVAAKVGINLNQ